MPPSIQVSNLSFTHQNGNVALDNISFKINPGSRILLVGANGSGKVSQTNTL